MPHVLIIDDDAPARAYLRLALEQLDCRVSECQDGNAAIPIYTAERPDLVLCALDMQLRAGIPTIRHLRGLDPMAKIVGMANGRRATTANTVGLARHFGAALIARKPLHVVALQAILDQFRLIRSHEPPDRPLGSTELA